MKSVSHRIPIVVSACLLGWKVRYDGKDKRHDRALALLQGEWLVVPVCPEVAVGLGVPRQPLELVSGAKGVRIQGAGKKGVDVTEALNHYARQIAEREPAIAGMISKSRSPSCGLAVSLHDPQGGILPEKVQGRFVHSLLECLPGLPVIEETDIDEDRKWQAFIDAVREYARHR